MPAPSAVAAVVNTDILKQQLELQKEILRNQQRSVELQEKLIAAILPGGAKVEQAGEKDAILQGGAEVEQAGEEASKWSKHKADDQVLAQVADEMKSAREGSMIESPGGLTEAGHMLSQSPEDDANVQQPANEAKEEPAKKELQEFLDKYDVQPERIPWFVAPFAGSFLGILKLSMWSHPGDLAVCFPDRSAFFEAAEAAMSPGRFRDFLVTSLELRLLFQSLLLSITVPASLSQPTPESTLDLVISVFTFLLGVLNTIGVCLCIFATGILSSVSENNFTAWLHANYRFVHAALSSQCAMVPMILFLQAASQIRTQLSVDWLNERTQTVLCAIQVAMIMLMMTTMLFATNAAGRTAAFSGAMGEAAIPSRKSIFASTLGGNKVGLAGIKEYLTAVMEDNATVQGKKSLMKRTMKKVDIKKFDISVF